MTSILRLPLTSVWTQNYLAITPTLNCIAGMLFRHSTLPQAQVLSQIGLTGRVVELLPQLEEKVDQEALVAYYDQFGGACVTTNGPHGVISMSLDLRLIDQDAWLAILLHESGHMHNDDAWYSCRQGASLSTVAAVAFVAAATLLGGGLGALAGYKRAQNALGAAEKAR